MKSFVLFLLLSASPALAHLPVVEAAEVVPSSSGWRVSVTISHPDTGWDHYADGWEVLDAAGNVLAERPLAHPHVTEQPFTRSVTMRSVPEGTKSVFIRAKCSVHGWTGPIFEVEMPN